MGKPIDNRNVMALRVEALDTAVPPRARKTGGLQ